MGQHIDIEHRLACGGLVHQLLFFVRVTFILDHLEALNWVTHEFAFVSQALPLENLGQVL